jgi:hypothetical protein
MRGTEELDAVSRRERTPHLGPAPHPHPRCCSGGRRLERPPTCRSGLAGFTLAEFTLAEFTPAEFQLAEFLLAESRETEPARAQFTARTLVGAVSSVAVFLGTVSPFAA